MPRVAVPGAEIFYRLEGEGPPLLLIRGYGSHSGWWDPLFLEPLRQRFRLILYDHRGTGGSTHLRGEYSMRRLADDAASLLLGMGLEGVGVFGLSMGGMVAQELALGYPSLVGGLVLGATHCGGERAVPPRPEAARALAERAAGKGVGREWLQAVFTPAFAAGERETVRRYLERAALDPVPPEIVEMQKRAVAEFDSWERLPRVAAPTLVLHGEDDAVVPADNARRLAGRIPGARLELLPGVGHDFTVQAPRRSARLLLGFLQPAPGS